MEQKFFGKNPFSVTPFGLGLAALGRPGYITLGHREDLKRNYNIAAMEAHAHRMLDAAWEAGIRYFDTARSYGRAEAFLSSWLKKRRILPTEIAVGSKWGYTYTANWKITLKKGEHHEVKEHSLTRLEKQHNESKALLGNYLKLYQIHSATEESGVFKNQAVLKELARLRNAGLAIGFSVSGNKQAEAIESALEISFDGVPLFSSVQATWNLLEQSATSALNAAHAAGLGIIIKEALANGRLTERNRSEDFRRKRQILKSQAESHQTSMDALALAAVFAQPFADVVLSGAARVADLQSNLQALKISWDDSLESLRENLLEPPTVYWHKRSLLTWN